jgi:hypothetical protein
MKGMSERWTIHTCEDHRVQNCSYCGVFDVRTVVDEREFERLREAARKLIGVFDDPDGKWGAAINELEDAAGLSQHGYP